MADGASRRRRASGRTLAIVLVALLGMLALLWALRGAPPPPPPAPPDSLAVVPPPSAPEPPAISRDLCETEARVFRQGIRSWSRELALPATGRFVEEAHYVTREDSFGAAPYPGSMDERIELHLYRSLRLYRRFDPSMTREKLYPAWFQQVWTPAEGGNIGQGSTGPAQRESLDPEEEMWLITMQWLEGQRPPIGTRLLLRANGRQVVVVAGYETGPEQEKYLGGVTPEVHRWLGTHNGSRIEAHYLPDSTWPAGPTRCRLAPARSTAAQGRGNTLWAVKSTQ